MIHPRLATAMIHFLLFAFLSGCKEDPVVQEFEALATSACDCDTLECHTRLTDEIMATVSRMEKKRVSQAEYNKVETAIAKAKDCIKENEARYLEQLTQERMQQEAAHEDPSSPPSPSGNGAPSSTPAPKQ